MKLSSCSRFKKHSFGAFSAVVLFYYVNGLVNVCNYGNGNCCIGFYSCQTKDYYYQICLQVMFVCNRKSVFVSSSYHFSISMHKN